MVTHEIPLTRRMGALFVVLLAFGLTACGGPPKWVKQGSGAYNEKDAKNFYGVGAVTGVRNEPLAWDTAENRARAEIAKTFDTYTGYLMRDYAASTTAGCSINLDSISKGEHQMPPTFSMSSLRPQ